MVYIFEEASATPREPVAEPPRFERVEREVGSTDELSPQSVAQAHYASQLVATYGDADRGYLILHSITGFYRFLRYGGASSRMGNQFATESQAILGAYEECQRQPAFGADRGWVAELRAVADLLTPGGLR